MATGVARVGDPASHGGTLSSGSPALNDDGKAVCRVGDIYNCPTHGSNPIVTGSSILFDEGKGVATIGSTTQCGATITAGSTDFLT